MQTQWVPQQENGITRLTSAPAIGGRRGAESGNHGFSDVFDATVKRQDTPRTRTETVSAKDAAVSAKPVPRPVIKAAEDKSEASPKPAQKMDENQEAAVKKPESASGQEKPAKVADKPADQAATAESAQKVEKPEDTAKNPQEEQTQQAVRAADAILALLAQIVGVKPDELKSAMEQRGIDTAKADGATILKAFADMTGIQIPEGKLDAFLAKLTDLLKQPDEVQNLLSSKPQPTEGKNKTEQNVLPAVITDLRKLMAATPERLQQAGQLVRQMAVQQQAAEVMQKPAEQAVHTETAAAQQGHVQGPVKQPEQNLQQNAQQNQQGNTPQDKPGIREVAAENARQTPVKAAEEEAGKALRTEGVTEAGAKPLQAVQNVPGASVQRVQPADVKGVATERPTVPVSPKEIMQQVTDKARVLLTPDKSEMVMELKPDSLGKISMKISTEQGIVAAKIVAENEQVKQVLESSFQSLKDSLEKQGLSIQSFSVSVGQQNQHHQQQANDRHQRTTEGSNRQSVSAAGMVSVSGYMADHAARNPYLHDPDSTINLTA